MKSEKGIHPNTGILTPDGIKKINDINIGDRVYSMNIYRKELNTVIDTVKDKRKSSTKELFRFYNKHSMGCDIRVTHDYYMIIKKNYRSDNVYYPTASDLVDINRYTSFIKPSNIVHDCSYGNFVHIKGYTDRIYDTNDFLGLLGWYISEGCIHEIDTKIGNMEYDIHVDKSIIMAKYFYCEIGQSLENEDYVDKIAHLLDRMKIRYNYGSDRFNIANSDIVNVLAYYGGRYSENKCIHKDIFNSSKTQLRNLFESLNMGDAHIVDGEKGGTLYRYKTISTNLVNDIILLANILGYRTYSSTYVGQHTVNMSDAYNIYTQHLKVDIVEHDGDIYNIKVEKNHNYFAGDNGKFVLVHD